MSQPALDYKLFGQELGNPSLEGIPPSRGLQQLFSVPRQSPMDWEKSARLFVQRNLQEVAVTVSRMDISLPVGYLEGMAVVTDQLFAHSSLVVARALASDQEGRPSLGSYLAQERKDRRERKAYLKSKR